MTQAESYLSLYDAIHFYISCIQVLDRRLALVGRRSEFTKKTDEVRKCGSGENQKSRLLIKTLFQALILPVSPDSSRFISY